MGTLSPRVTACHSLSPPVPAPCGCSLLAIIFDAHHHLAFNSSRRPQHSEPGWGRVPSVTPPQLLGLPLMPHDGVRFPTAGMSKWWPTFPIPTIQSTPSAQTHPSHCYCIPPRQPALRTSPLPSQLLRYLLLQEAALIPFLSKCPTPPAFNLSSQETGHTAPISWAGLVSRDPEFIYLDSQLLG